MCLKNFVENRASAEYERTNFWKSGYRASFPLVNNEQFRVKMFTSPLVEKLDERTNFWRSGYRVSFPLV